MAGILDLTAAAPRGGLLGGFTDNAMLGYLAGALNGGNLGRSIGRGLEGWMRGARLDDQRRVPAQTYAALAAAGVPDALSQAAALNPAVMKVIAPGYFGAKADGSGETATLTPIVNDAARDAPREPSFDTAAVAALNTAVTRLGDFARAADEFSSPSSAHPRESGEPAAAVRGSGSPLSRGRTEGGGAAVSPPRQPPQMLARNAGDIAQALRASGIGDDDLRALAGTLESSRSSAEFKAAVGRTLDLLGARLEQLQAQLRGRIPSLPALLSPRAKATLEKLRQWSAAGSPPGNSREGSGRD